MQETLSGNLFAQTRYKELVTERVKPIENECVKDFCPCDCHKCINKRNDYAKFLEETDGT